MGLLLLYLKKKVGLLQYFWQIKTQATIYSPAHLKTEKYMHHITSLKSHINE